MKQINLISYVFTFLLVLSFANAIPVGNSFISPVVNSYVNGSPVFFNVSVDSSILGIDFNGASMCDTDANGYCSFMIPGSEFTNGILNTITFDFIDSGAGFSDSVSFYYNIPIFISPVVNSYVNGSPVFFNVSVDSSILGIDFNGASMCDTDANGYCSFMIPGSEFTNGILNTITFDFIDSGAGFSDSVSFYYNIPIFISPVVNSYVNGSPVFFNVSVDSSILGIDFNGASMCDTDANGYCSFMIPGSEFTNGILNTITFDFIDSGAGFSDSVSFYYDTTAPIITIAPYDNVNSTNQDIVVNATVNEGTLNNNSVTFTENGNFTFIATDAAGNSANITVEITNIDKIAPIITIAPYDNVNSTNQDIVVNATVNEGTLNNNSVTFTENGNFTFIATDAAGNSANITVEITNIDKIAPIITIAPYDNVNSTNQDIVVNATVNEGTLNNNSVTFTENGNFTFIATDAAGNSANITVEITNIDKTPVVIQTTGGGGGYCTTEWEISDWSACNNGVQTRDVTFQDNFCTPRAEKPMELQACTVTPQTQTTETEDETNTNTETRGPLAGITGAVIGTPAGRWSLGIVLLLILIGLAWWIVAAKKKKADKKVSKK